MDAGPERRGQHLHLLRETTESIAWYLRDSRRRSPALQAMVRQAVGAQLVRLGELAARVPDATRATLPGVPWETLEGYRALAGRALTDAEWQALDELIPALRERLVALAADGQPAPRGHDASDPRRHLAIPPDIAEICRRAGVRELALFGAVTSEDFPPERPVDVLIELEPEARLGLLELAALRDELSAAFGRAVSLAFRRDLPERLRPAVERTAWLVYRRDAG